MKEDQDPQHNDKCKYTGSHIQAFCGSLSASSQSALTADFLRIIPVLAPIATIASKRKYHFDISGRTLTIRIMHGAVNCTDETDLYASVTVSCLDSESGPCLNAFGCLKKVVFQG